MAAENACHAHWRWGENTTVLAWQKPTQDLSNPLHLVASSGQNHLLPGTTPLNAACKGGVDRALLGGQHDGAPEGNGVGCSPVPHHAKINGYRGRQCIQRRQARQPLTGMTHWPIDLGLKHGGLRPICIRSHPSCSEAQNLVAHIRMGNFPL
jgi:hypothetical protein